MPAGAVMRPIADRVDALAEQAVAQRCPTKCRSTEDYIRGASEQFFLL